MKVLYFSIGSMLLFLQACIQAPERAGGIAEPQGFDTAAYVERGSELVMATKQQLSTNLVGAITEHGTKHALEFCSTKAIALTDSMSSVLEAKIKRVSDQPRNPNNKATGREMEYIVAAKQRIANGYELTPEVHQDDERIIGYYPIVTNALCMQCHGQPHSQILPPSMAMIDSLYPNDQAIGYSENELRGIFVVEMNK